RRSRGQRNRFGSYAKERSFVGIQHAPSIKLDDNAKHVVVLQQVGNGPHSRHKGPRQIKRVGSQPGEDTKSAVGSGCSVPIVDHHTKRVSVRQSDGASLDGFCARRTALQRVKTAGETYLLIAGLELRGVAETHQGSLPDDYRATHR